MAAETMHGGTLLFDESRGVVLRGEIRLITDGKGRSEIHVTNDVTGIAEHLVFQSGALWIPVMQLIQAIQDTHTDVTVPLANGSQGTCVSCGGVGEVADDDGNWRVCGQCGGRI